MTAEGGGARAAELHDRSLVALDTRVQLRDQTGPPLKPGVGVGDVGVGMGSEGGGGGGMGGQTWAP